MAGKPKPDWDKSVEPPDYRVDRSSSQYPTERTGVQDYGASTNTTQARAARNMAAEVARRRRQRSFANGRWFEGNQLIGTSENEGSVIHRVKPRSLRQRGLS